jgi:AraC-like DNA-binding protein
MAVVFLVVFVVEVSLYVGLRRLYERTVVDLQFRLIEQSQRTTESFLRQAERHALATASLPDLNLLLNREFLLFSGYDRFMRMQSAVGAVLSGFGSESVHSAYAYSGTQDMVFAPGGFAAPARFPEADFIASFRQSPRFFSWYPSHAYGSTSARVISYVVPVPVTDARRGSFLVVNIDANFLERVVTRNNQADSFELFVLTEEGLPVFVGNEELFGELARSSALPDLIESRQGGHSVVSVGDATYYAAAQSFGSSGWRYVTLGQRDRLLLGTERFARVALIVAGLCVVVAGIVVAAFARVFYRPVERLSAQVQQAFDSLGLDVADGDDERNELRRIAWEFSVLVEANQEYARRLLRDREALQETLLRDILNQRYTSVDEIRARASELAFPLGEHRLGLLLVVSHPYSDTAAERVARREAIEDVVEDQTSPGAAFFVLAEAGYYVIVVDLSGGASAGDGSTGDRSAGDRSASEGSAALDHLAEALSVLVERADDQLVISGGVVDSFDELSVRYRSAVRLYGMRRVIVRRRILRVADADPLDAASRETTEFEQAIASYRHALEILDLERAASTGRAILENLGSSSDLVYRQAKINEVGNALILTVLTNTSPGEIFPPDSSPWATYQQLGSVHAVQEWLADTVRELDAVLHARRQAGQTRLVNKIRSEIDGRYTEPITVQELADGQQITPSYLSSLFHEETGRTLSQCIAEKRLEHACRLLRETDMLVKRIASESGYGQKQNMIRAFKRQLQMTPGEYRKQNQVTTQ